MALLVCVVLGITGFLVVLSGVVSNRVDMMVVGAVWLFAATSAYLTFYVKSEYRVKRALEVIFALLALSVVTYGHVITGSFILGVIVLFIVAMVIAALIVPIIPTAVSILAPWKGF